MSWCIKSAIVRGEIDNTTPGRTTGRLWLIHQSEPVELILEGDCWRDLAGCILTFRNPQPDQSLEAPELSNPQLGLVGDMTASLKRKVYEDNSNPDPQQDFTWQNHLSLEWFDQINGRVVIETPLFEMTLSDSHWQQTAAEELVQQKRNLDAMRDYVCTFLQREANLDLWADDNVDEFAWEKRFQESDRMTEIYGEIFEKYIDDADAQQKQAYAMGLDQLFDDAAGHADFDSGDDELIESSEDTWDTDFNFEIDDDELHGFKVHPLQRKAQDLAMEALDFCGDQMDQVEAVGKLCSLLLQVASKLAGALNFNSEEFGQETGYILASLKRCLHWQNDAIASCHELLQLSVTRDEEQALLKIRATIFEIRDQITELRREFKQN
jgi:hypothetical protein